MSNLAYLACPYNSPDKGIVAKRFAQATRVAAELLKKKIFVFSPITHGAALIEHGGLKAGWDNWAEYDRTIIERCDKVIVLMLPGWEFSKGVMAEIEIAKELGKLVEYLDPNEFIYP
ncbi:MAG: DUF1937 family protein [Bdellovibrionota bacterium]